MLKKKVKTLEQLREDKEKVIGDMQRLQEQLIGTRFVLMYLNQEIQKLGGAK